MNPYMEGLKVENFLHDEIHRQHGPSGQRFEIPIQTLPVKSKKKKSWEPGGSPLGYEFFNFFFSAGMDYDTIAVKEKKRDGVPHAPHASWKSASSRKSPAG